MFTWFSHKEALKCGRKQPWKEHALHSSCLLFKHFAAFLQRCSEVYFRNWLLYCRVGCQGWPASHMRFWRRGEGVPPVIHQGRAFQAKRGSPEPAASSGRLIGRLLVGFVSKTFHMG